MTKPSPAQRQALLTVRRHATEGTYMPYADGVRPFEACERKGWLIYRHIGEPGIRLNGYELTAEGAAQIADETPDYLKFGYEHNRERERIGAHLRRRLPNHSMTAIEFRISRIQERLVKYRPSLRDRQALWLAKQPKRIEPAPTFTTDELARLVELFAGANDLLTASIADKAARMLDR